MTENRRKALKTVLDTPAVRFGGRNAKAILALLISMAQRNDYGHLESWPSINYLSRMNDCSRNTIRRGIRSLEAAGLVERLQDSGRSNLYRIHEDRVHAVSDITCTLEDNPRCQYLGR